MPELPEVETVVRQLSPVLSGKLILNAAVFDRKLAKPSLAARLNGARIEGVFRAGKQIVLRLKAGDGRAFYLGVHLRMTGRLLWQPAAGRRGRAAGANKPFYFGVDAQEKHLRASLSFADGHLTFYDVRRFGTWIVTDDFRTLLPKGVDPLSPACTGERLSAMLKRSGLSVRSFLLSQDKIVGLGNIYVCEILFAAGIHPRRPARTLAKDETRALWRSMRKILRKAIVRSGTTFSDFQGISGETGGYQDFLKVYMREGEACARCAGAVSRRKESGRSSYYCGSCQK